MFGSGHGDSMASMRWRAWARFEREVGCSYLMLGGKPSPAQVRSVNPPEDHALIARVEDIASLILVTPAWANDQIHRDSGFIENELEHLRLLL